MTWLVTGAGGMLGTDLTTLLRARGTTVVAPGHKDLDLCDAAAIYDHLDRHRPAVVVNCAAWTAVDAAEDHEAEALAVNGTAVEALAKACEAGRSQLIQVSTDYVLTGSGRAPQPESAPTGPVNAYGRTKLAGERAALEIAGGQVVRTAWLYGAHGHSFPRTMLRLAGERDLLDVVDDQRGQPTWSMDLAERIIALGDSAAPAGIYHATNAGETTWYALAREIFTLLGLDPDRVRPITSDMYPRPAHRPANSVLGHDGWAAAGLPPMRDWRAALHAAWPTLINAWG